MSQRKIISAVCAAALALCGNSAAYAENFNFTAEKNFSVSPPKFGAAFSENEEALVINPYYTYTGETSTLYSGMNTLPSAYDMRDDYAVSSVKKQTGFGTCWVHSAIASAEASIIEAVPDVDLSEFHSAYYPYYDDEHIKRDVSSADDILNLGGNMHIITNIWSQWIGPVSESRIPYRDTDFFENAEDVYNMRNVSDYHLENAYMFDYDRKRTNEEEVNNLIKQLVHDGKPVAVSFYQDNSVAYSSVNKCSYSKKPPRFANHAVAVIGWDDDFPADNFRTKPEHNGAWLVKNSYGSNYADSGYMWISYDDKSLGEFAVFELADKDDYTVMYSHDTFVSVQDISVFETSEINAPSYMANVFENHSDTDIEAVSTYIRNAGTEYEITVYTGLSDISDPCSGTPSAVTAGRADMTGFFTLKLDEKVSLSADDSLFSVVVKLYNEETPFVVPVETCMTVTDDNTGEISDLSAYVAHEQIEEFTDKNRSFFSEDGESWADSSETYCVYTEEEEQYILEDLREQLMEGIEETDTEEISNIEKVIKSYEEKFNSGYVSLILGNIPLKALGNPGNTVRFSHISGEVPLDEKIELSGADEIYFYTDSPENFMTYSEPIAVDKPVTIYASSDGVNFSSRKYEPACAQLNFLNYRTADVFAAEKFTKSRYNIYVNEGISEIMLYPSSAAVLEYEGAEIPSDTYSISISPDKSALSVKIRAVSENKLSNDISVNIYRTSAENPIAGDINGDGFADANDASGILRHYANTSNGGGGTIEPEYLPLADMNADGLCDASDASDVLMYYSLFSTRG